MVLPSKHAKPVEGFLGGTQVVLGLLQLPHPALPALLLLYARLICSVCISGQSACCIHLHQHLLSSKCCTSIADSCTTAYRQSEYNKNAVCALSCISPEKVHAKIILRCTKQDICCYKQLGRLACRRADIIRTSCIPSLLAAIRGRDLTVQLA